MTDLFENKAKDWDSRPGPQIISEGVGTALLRNVDWQPSMRVMDFGAGTGLISSHIAPHVGRIWAVDLSESMLQRMAAKPDLEEKIETICQDIIATPLALTFDAIISAMALHHVADIETLLQRFNEGLETGGIVALADLDTEDGSFHSPGIEGVYHHGFDRGELQSRLESAGFINCQFETVAEVHKNEGRFPVFLVTATKA